LAFSSVRSFVCLSVAKKRTQKRNFLKKTTPFKPVVSIEDLEEAPRGLFKEPIIGPLKFKIAKKIVKSSYLNEKTSNCDEIWYTAAHLERDNSPMTKQ